MVKHCNHSRRTPNTDCRVDMICPARQFVNDDVCSWISTSVTHSLKDRNPNQDTAECSVCDLHAFRAPARRMPAGVKIRVGVCLFASSLSDSLCVCHRLFWIGEVEEGVMIRPPVTGEPAMSRITVFRFDKGSSDSR